MMGNQQPVHAELPARGLHLKIDVAHPADEDQERLRSLFVDVAVEDICAVMAIGDLQTTPEGAESMDKGRKPTFEMRVYSGWVVRWSTVISVNAAAEIHRFFKCTDLRRDLRGSEALREFESREVQEVRHTQVSVVTAIWAGGEAEA